MSHRISLRRGSPAFNSLLARLMGGLPHGAFEDQSERTPNEHDKYEDQSPIASAAGHLRDAGHIAIGTYLEEEIATLPSLPAEVQAEIDQAKAAAEQAKQSLTNLYEAMQRATQKYTTARNADKLLMNQD